MLAFVTTWMHGRSTEKGTKPTDLDANGKKVDSKTQPNTGRSNGDGTCRTEGVLKQLQKHHLLLVEKLNLELVLPFLFDNQVITKEEFVSVQMMEVPYKANSMFLRLLHQKPEWCQKLFVESLVQTCSPDMASCTFM